MVGQREMSVFAEINYLTKARKAQLYISTYRRHGSSHLGVKIEIFSRTVHVFEKYLI